MRCSLTGITFLLFFCIVLTSCASTDFDDDMLFGGDPRSRDTAYSNETENSANDKTRMGHVRVMSGQDIIHPYSFFTWSKTDNGDGTISETFADTMTIEQIVSGDTFFDVSKIPVIYLTQKIEVTAQDDVSIESVDLISCVAGDFITTGTTLDELSSLPVGEYYICMKILVNSTEKEPINQYRYNEVFKLVVKES